MLVFQQDQEGYEMVLQLQELYIQTQVSCFKYWDWNPWALKETAVLLALQVFSTPMFSIPDNIPVQGILGLLRFNFSSRNPCKYHIEKQTGVNGNTVDIDLVKLHHIGESNTRGIFASIFRTQYNFGKDLQATISPINLLLGIQ